MQHILVDTGAWYAYMDKDDPDHERVAEVLEAHYPLLLTTDFIADEALTLLRYRAGRNAAIRFGELLYSGTLCRLEYITKADQQKAWALFLKYSDHCFSFTDCTSFVVTQRLQVGTAIAIDSDFRAYGLHCLPVNP